MPEKKSKKWIRGLRDRMAILFAVATLVVLIFPLFTQGADEPPTSLECGITTLSPQGLVSCLIYYVTLLIVAILKLFVVLGAWITKIGLEFSKGVINSPSVQTGFSVSLSIANLGFVLGIIVVAIATILRSQTYGIKQILWKLVVAAILVNFSLVIAGTILNVSDRFTSYFTEAASGGDVTAFANKLVGSLANPQGLAKAPGTDKANIKNIMRTALFAATAGISEVTFQLYDFVDSGLSKDNRFWSDLTQQLLNLVFVSVFLSIIALTFMALGILLMVRYVYIGILLILAPLAWLTWVFPRFSSNFSKWWQQFLRWAFFPMFVTFFLYLAMVTAQNKEAYIDPKLVPDGIGPEMGLAVQIGNADILQNAGQTIIIIGLALGGIFAANAMSIKGANVAMGAMKSVGSLASGYVGKQGKKMASRAVPTGTKEKLQRGELSRFIPRRIQSWAGRGLETVEKKGGSELVAREAAWAREKARNPEEGARLLAGSLNPEQRFALMKQMMSQGDIGKVQTINGMPADQFLLANEKKMADYGEVKLSKDISKARGHTPQEAEATRAITEKAKENKQFDTADRAFKSSKEVMEKIAKAEDNARKALAKDPNAVVTDMDGTVTGKIGTPTKASDFIDRATERYVEVAELNKKSGDLRNSIMDEAKGKATVIDRKGALGEGVGATVNADEFAKKEAENLAEDMKKEDVAKVQGNDMFGKGPRMGFDETTADLLARRFAEALANKGPQLASSLLPRMKSEPLAKFQDIYSKILDNLIAQAGTNTQLVEHLTKIKRSFDKSINYNIMAGRYSGERFDEGTEEEEVSGGGGGGGEGGEGGGGKKT